MEPHLIEVAEILNRYPEVRWDRLTRLGNVYISVFGWLDRDDGKADFVVIDWTRFDGEVETRIKTSSAQWSREFGQRLHGNIVGSTHIGCERVEDVFGDAVPGCIMLKKE